MAPPCSVNEPPIGPPLVCCACWFACSVHLLCASPAGATARHRLRSRAPTHATFSRSLARLLAHPVFIQGMKELKRDANLEKDASAAVTAKVRKWLG